MHSRDHPVLRGRSALLVAALLLFGVNLALKYPGTLNSDSIGQMRQAIEGHYDDWHPPVMAWLWSFLAPERTGSAGMLLVQLALHWFGFHSIAETLRRSGGIGIAWIVLASGAFPVFLYYNGLITKDVGMAVSYLAAFAIGFRYLVENRRIPLHALGLIVVLLAYGTLVRTNAIFALGPMAIFLLGARWRHRSPGAWILASIVITTLALPVSTAINRHLLKARDSGAIQSLILFDLDGIARHAGSTEMLPEELQADEATIQRCYTPYFWDTWSPWGTCSEFWKKLGAEDSASRRALPRLWGEAIIHHPIAYLEHRLKAFNSILSFLVPASHCRFAPGCGQVDPETGTRKAIGESEIRMDYVKRSPIVWPVSWLVVAAVLALASSLSTVRRQDDAGVLAVRALSLSAFFYLSTLLLIGVATDVRYAYWSIVASLVAIFLAVDARRRGAMSFSPVLKPGLAVLVLVWIAGLTTRLSGFTGFVH